MIWLTKEQVLYLHSQVVGATGGLDSLRDEGLLESAISMPLQTFGEQDLYPTLIDKAVRLACGLTCNHPFADGNKRIGVHAMLVVLSLNRIPLEYEQNELSDIFLGLADGKVDFDELRHWVYSHLKIEKL